MDELDLDGLGPGPFDSKGHYGSSSVPGVDDDDFLPQHHPEDDDPFGLLSGQYELNPDEYLLNQATGGGDGNGVWNSAADDDPFGGPSTSVHSDNQNIEDHSGLFTDNDHHLMASTANFGDQEDEEFETSNSPLKRSQRASVSMMNSGGDYHLSVKQEPAEDEDELNTAVALQNENTPAEASSSSAALNNDNNSTETRSKTSARDQPENTSSSTISTTTTTTTTTTSDPKEKAPSRGTFWDYECTVCGRGFKRRVALEQHQQTAHGYGEAEDDPTSHLASGRSARIAAAAAAYEASSHHNSSGSGGATSFRSSVPSTSTPTTPTTTTGRSQPFQCPHCRKVIRSRGALTNHIRSHQRRAFACGRCDAFFGDAVELQTHIDRAHPSERHGSFSGAQQLETVSPSKIFRGNALTSASATSGDLESSCRYCGENFAGRPEVLIEHVRVVHHSGALCECPHCGQQVKNKYRLEEHITRRHSNYRPHRCDFEGCQRAFVTNTELKVHNRVHTGERPYVCAMCGFGFTVHSNLVKHMKKQHRVDFAAPRGGRGGSRSGGQTFMGGARGQVTATPPSTAISTVSAAAQAASAAMKAQIKNFTRSLPPDRRSGPVKCPQCPAVIRSKYSLEDHMKRRHSNIRPHRCNHCPRRFVSASELVIHTRVHTGERPFSCEICNAGFTTKSSLVKHCRCMHGKDIRSFMKGGGKGRFGQRVPLPVQSASSSNSAEQRSNRSTSVQHFPRRHFGNELRLSSSAYSSQEHQNSQHQQSSSFQHSPPPPPPQQQQQQPIILNQYGEEEIPVDVKPAIFFCPYCPRGFTAQYNHTVHLRSHPEYQEEMRRKRRSDADDLNGGDGGDQEPQGQGQGPQGLQGQQGRQVQPEGGNGFRNNNGGSGGGGGGGGGGGSGNNRSGHQCDHCSMSFILQQDLMRHQQLTHRYHPGSKGGSANDNDLLADDDDEEEEDYVHLEPQVSFNEGGEEEGGDGENGADHGLEDDHHQNEDQFDDQGHQQLQNEIEDSQPDDTQDQQQQEEEDEEKEEEEEKGPSQPADPDRPFQCHECPRRFGDEAALEEHQVTHLFTVSYSCRVCGQAMEGKEELVSHMKVHYGSGGGGSKKGPIPVQVSTDSSAKPRQQSSSSSSGGQPSPSPSTGTRSPAPIISQQQPLVSSNPAIRIRIVNGSSGVNATSTITSSPSTLNSTSEPPSKRPLPQSLSQHFSQQQRTSSQQTSTSSTSSNSSNSSPSSQRDQLVGPNSSTSSEGLRQKVQHQCPVCKRYFEKKGSLTNHLKAHQNESLAEQMRSQPKIAINGGGGGDNGGNGGDGGGGDDYDSLPMLGEKMGPRVGLNALGQLDRSVSKLGYACTLCEKSFHHASTLKTHLLFSHNIVEGSGSGSSAASAAAAAANGMAKRNGNGSGSSAYAARTQQQQQQRSFGNRGNSLMVNGVGSRQQQMQNSGRPTSLGSGSVRGDGYQQQQQQQQRQSLLTSSSSSVRANGFGGQQQQQYQQRSSRPSNVVINGRPTAATATSSSSSTSALTPYSNIRRASLLHPPPPPSSSQVNGEGKATPFQCQLCNRAFTAQRYLTNHVKSHRNETIRAEDLEEVPEVVEEEEVEEVQQGEDAPQEEEEVVDNAAGLFQQNGFYEVEGGGEDGGEEGGDDDDDGLEILNGLDVNLEGDDLPSNLWLDEDDDDQDFGGGGDGDGYQQQHQPLQTMMEGEGGDDFEEELHDEEQDQEQLMDTGNMAAEGENGGGEEGNEEENPYQEQEFHDDDGMADQQNGDLGDEGGGGWEEQEGGEGLDADYGGDDQFNGGGGGDDGVENGEEDDFEELPPADSSPSSASFNGRLNTGNAHLNRIFQSNVFSKERDRDPLGALPKDSHPCPHCKKAFSSRANLVIHIRIHTGERPYRCADCRVAFTSSSHFYRHQRSAAHARVVSGAQPSTRWQY